MTMSSCKSEWWDCNAPTEVGFGGAASNRRVQSDTGETTAPAPDPGKGEVSLGVYENPATEGLAGRFRTAEVAKRATIAAKALGISKEAGRKTVARTFYKHAKVLHPDKGGDKEDFQVLNEAYMKMQRLSS